MEEQVEVVNEVLHEVAEDVANPTEEHAEVVNEVLHEVLHELTTEQADKMYGPYEWNPEALDSLNEVNGSNALHDAMEMEDARLVKLMLNHGANVNMPDYLDWTPLHHAMPLENDDCARALIEMGANIELLNAGGATPLHLAAYYSQFKNVKLLMERNANVLVRDEEGRDAPAIARKQLRGNTDPDAISTASLLDMVGDIALTRQNRENAANAELLEEDGVEDVEEVIPSCPNCMKNEVTIHLNCGHALCANCDPEKGPQCGSPVLTKKNLSLVTE